MWEYLKRHEQMVAEQLAQENDRDRLEQLRSFHATQIRYMQHERLIHLVVTMFVLLFFLLCFAFAALNSSWPALLAASLLLILSAFYLVHYFRLENGVQRWYRLANRIEAALNRVTLPPP